MGGPKALVDLDGEPLLLRALAALTGGGCAPVVVVLGAAATAAARLVPDGVRTVVAEGWEEGMGASLRAGIAALGATDADSAVVHLVDLPGVGAAAVERLVGVAGPDALVRAAYDGRPGHPVLLGRTHWAGVAAVATGDAGAREYLAGNRELALIECGDVASPGDIDTPEALARFRASR
jgi:CTP:molybdopterin cytidylyltransferase MocA